MVSKNLYQLGSLKEPKLMSRDIYERLRDTIIDGKLRGRDRIVESELAKTWGVSRQPIREALGMLETDGFIELIPHRGAVVTDITAKEVRENLQIKAMVEGYASWVDAKRFGKKDIADLELILENMERDIEQEDVQGILNGNFEFHRKLVDGVANEKISRYYDSLTQFLRRFYTISLTKKYNWNPSLFEHRQVLDFIKSKNAEAAEAATRQHAFNSIDRALRQLELVGE